MRDHPVPVLLIIVLVLAAGCFGAPGHRGPVSDHFDGETFYNPEPSTRPASGDGFLRWRRLRLPTEPWQKVVPSRVWPPPPQRVGAGDMRVTFVGHATVLVQMDGLNILTDPIYAERASPVSFAGPERMSRPGVAFEDLPPIDVVLISHNHYDHLDESTLARLAETHAPHVYAGLGIRQFLVAEDLVANEALATDLDWWQQAQLSPDVKAISVPVQHFSGRGLGDRNQTLWTGWVIDGPAGRVYFGGDTGYGPHFAEVGEKLGPFRLAVLPVGAFRPRWFMSYVHIGPPEAVDAHIELRANQSMGVHWGTFPLADDAMGDPARLLATALDERNIAAERFWMLDFGEGRDVPPMPGQPDQ